MKNKLFVSIATIFASAVAMAAEVSTPAPAAQNATVAAPAVDSQCCSQKEVNTLFENELLAKPFERFSASATVAYESEYIFRGKYQSGHGINPIVDMGYDIGSGFAAYAEYWGFYGVDNSFGENDFYAGITYTIENVTFDVGYLGYTYNEDNTTNENEFMVNVSYDTVDFFGDFNVSPFAAFYYNYTYSGTTVEGGLSYAAPVTKWLIDENWGTLNFAAYVGYADYCGGLTNGGYVYTGVSVDAVIQVTDNMAIAGGVRWSCNNDGKSENIGEREQNISFGTAIIFGF